MSDNLIVTESLLVAFLQDARRHSWAGGRDAVRDRGRKSYEHLSHSEPFVYRDVYVGGRVDTGMETLSVADYPVWSMAYRGGIFPRVAIDKEVVYAALRKALCTPAEAAFHRGPARLQVGPFTYLFSCKGHFDDFTARESLYWNDEIIYRRSCLGGFVTCSPIEVRAH